MNCIKFNSKTIRCRSYAKYDHVEMYKDSKTLFGVFILKNFFWCNSLKINETVSPKFIFQYDPRISIEKKA